MVLSSSIPQRATDQRLALMQLSSAFFPSGSFTLSHGLETLVQTQMIRSPEDVKRFLQVMLHNKVGATDGVALRHAHRASVNDQHDEIVAIDQRLFAQTLLNPVRESQRKTGRALLRVARSTWPHPRLEHLHRAIQAQTTPGLHPVMFAVVGQVAGLDEDSTVFAFLHNFLTELCGAAIRLGVLGHVSAQILVQELGPELEAIAHSSADAEMEDLWSCTPFLDIAQLSHSALPQRLFTT